MALLRDAAYFTESFAPVLYRVPLDGGEPVQLTRAKKSSNAPAWCRLAAKGR